ncbi:hypothetical protein [Chitinophaga flava]|uniref:Uncharacterized protein n=1 Tax=Chitinophaga flava TaxID=2259036 RepID=A0A365XYV4_9BACT|nr:hypothetical protein [Chitinophaga flava]RBL91248.1 hypothetical protein DF182_01080 [Chitinophaga flava]
MDLEMLLDTFSGGISELENIRCMAETLMRTCYTDVLLLKEMSLQEELSLDFIQQVEDRFLRNDFRKIKEYSFSNRYLQKYCLKVISFFDSYEYYPGSLLSMGKDNLFVILKEGYQNNKRRGYLADVCARVGRNMEEAWMAASQVYAKTEMELLKCQNRRKETTTSK